ncbi:MAG TPA: hypothetical protein VJK02_13985 [Anaerolineales bacterium]|nr:hypothetical protein [Anaerolineales bacterium]
MRTTTVLILSLLVLILPACSPQPAGPTEVQVTLTEFAIESSLTTFQAGVPYRFVVTNAGAVAHELMITPKSMGGMSMEDMHELALMEIEEEDLPSGATVTMEFTFPEDAVGSDLEFSCYVPGHYEAGMFLAINVE